MLVDLPRKVDTMLSRAAERTLLCANLAHVERNRSGSLSRGKGISVCCDLSVETVLCRGTASINSHTRLPHCMLDANTVNKRTSLVRARQPRAIDTLCSKWEQEEPFF
jgi:hypothetical protein